MSKILYLDCPTGIAGDMLLAALLDAGGEMASLRQQLACLELGHWEINCQRVNKKGLSALQIAVTFSPQQHRSYRHIRELIKQAAWPDQAKSRALASFRVLAEAEAQVHGCAVEAVHFHETGAVDSIIDICGTALLLDQIGIAKIYYSALPLSSGTVQCAHGVLPVPAPATALLMRGMRLTPSPLEGETVTPTGAAILQGCGAIQAMPHLTLTAIGYGAGSRDFPQQANILRAWVGEASKLAVAGSIERDSVEVLRTNIDDASGELLGQLWQHAFDLGALDMSYTPLLMKKGRPGWTLELIVPDGRGAAFAELIFQESCSTGVRVTREQRYLLPRHSETVETAYGPLTIKISGDTIAPEADEIQAAADRSQATFKTVYQAAIAAYWQQKAAQTK